MKHEYVTLRKKLPNGKWELDVDEGTNIVNLTKSNANDTLIKRHTHFQGLGWAGHYGIEEVTHIRKGGSLKNTDSFDYFFDYTLVAGKSRVRYREGVRKV